MAASHIGRAVAVAGISLMLWLIPPAADTAAGTRLPSPHVDHRLFSGAVLLRGDLIVERALSMGHHNGHRLVVTRASINRTAR